MWFGEGIHCAWFSLRTNSGFAGPDSEQKAAYINSPCKRVLNVHVSLYMQAHGEATLCFRYILYGFLLMFQNKVNFCGECFMARFLLCVRQIKGSVDGWGEDEGAGLAFWEIIHPVASSAGIFSGRSSIQLPVLLQRIVKKKKKKIAGGYFPSNEFIQQRGLAGRRRWWKSFGFQACFPGLTF